MDELSDTLAATLRSVQDAAKTAMEAITASASGLARRIRPGSPRPGSR